MPKNPLDQWKKTNQPAQAFVAGFEKLKAIQQKHAGPSLLGQSQKFPPKYTLDVTPSVRLYHGMRFASVACVSDIIYFELCQWDEAFQKEMKKALKVKPGYEGYEFTLMPEELLNRLAGLVELASAKLLGQAKQDAARQPYQSKTMAKVPDAQLWTGPMSWAGLKAAASRNISRYIPSDAVFTRGELLCTLYENLGSGRQRQFEATLPALLQLEEVPVKGRPGPVQVIAAHVVGFDGQAWSFRLLMQNKLTFMPLYAGKSFEQQSEAPAKLLERYRFSRITIQSVLSAESGKAFVVNLRENFEIDTEEDEYDDDEE